MTNFEIYISKKSDRDLYDLVEDHPDFPNRSELVRYCLRKYVEEKNIFPINKKQGRKNKEADYISQSLKFMENIVRNKKDSRAITNDLHSNKLQPEVVALTAYLCEKVITIFKNTREIKSTVDYVSKHVMTKTDTKSQIRYKVIMDVCPNLISKSVKQQSAIKLIKEQSKIYQYPRPPPIKQQEDIDDLEEIIPGQDQKEEQENELIM